MLLYKQDIKIGNSRHQSHDCTNNMFYFIVLALVQHQYQSTYFEHTSSMPGMLLTGNFFNEFCSFLSSVFAVLWTTFLFLRGTPLPPTRTCSESLESFASLSVFMVKAEKGARDMKMVEVNMQQGK